MTRRRGEVISIVVPCEEHVRRSSRQRGDAAVSKTSSHHVTMITVRGGVIAFISISFLNSPTFANQRNGEEVGAEEVARTRSKATNQQRPRPRQPPDGLRARPAATQQLRKVRWFEALPDSELRLSLIHI